MAHHAVYLIPLTYYYKSHCFSFAYICLHINRDATPTPKDGVARHPPQNYIPTQVKIHLAEPIS